MSHTDALGWLLAHRTPEGAWAYRVGGPAQGEPTLLAIAAGAPEPRDWLDTADLGWAELLLGATSFDGSTINTGAVFLLAGGLSGTVSTDAAAASILGAEYSGAMGARLLEIGDVDGDGLVDLAVTETSGDGAATNSGMVWLFTGPLTGALDSSDAFASVTGRTNSERMGDALAAGGDLDGDGTDDLVLGAMLADDGGTNAGAAWVLYGPLSGSLVPGSTGHEAQVLGVDGSENLGLSLSIGGDFDSDGNADLVVGSVRGGSDNEGAAWLFLGPLSGSATTSDADGLILGDSTRQRLGSALLWTEGLLDTGYDELVVGAEGDNSGGTRAGAVGLYVGGPGL